MTQPSTVAADLGTCPPGSPADSRQVSDSKQPRKLGNIKRVAKASAALASACVFATISPDTIDEITRLNGEQRPNMMIAGTYVNRESAKLAHLLSHLVSVGTDARHLTFFANSSLEAVSGAVKLARHTSVRTRRADDGGILFVDRDGLHAAAFDPTGAGSKAALVPNIHYAGSNRAAISALPTGTWAGVVVDATDDADGAAAELLAAAAATGALRILLCTGVRPASADSITCGLAADVYVFGENLTDRQVPFGCFTMTKAAHSVWRNARDSGAHTSTFGGNAVCLSIALATLQRAGHVDGSTSEHFDVIDRDMPSRINAYRRHVNPHIAVGMQTFGFAFDINRAVGASLHLHDGRTILDFAGGTGANLRGHNPPDLTHDVLHQQSPEVDYFGRLRARLTELTGFDEAYPAVSGATAVDNCLTLGLLASPGRTKLVTFVGNYSGKTLPSMNLSKYGPSSVHSDRDAFAPYYRDLIYIDPFSPTSVEEFRKAVAKDDVAIVWFEQIQGMHCRPLTAPLIDAVVTLKARHGYLIGIDEVLTGVWRTGDSFLDHQRLHQAVDLASLAKPLSDMTLPIGVALATRDVHARATSRDKTAVEHVSHRYLNQLGAHIALHALHQVDTPHMHARRRQAHDTLKRGLEGVVGCSRLFDGVEGEGAHLRLVLKRRWFPFHRRSQLGQLVELAISDFVLQQCGVLVAQLRFFPAVFSQQSDVEEATAKLQAGLANRGPLSVYGHVLRRLASLTQAQLRSRVRRGQT
jgi:acetylornithine/succinyldiaminopimelate/putrescine aminotransferase